MKKIYTLLIAILVTTVTLFGQSDLVLNPRLNVPIATNNNNDNMKTTSCVDAILYPQSKLSGVPETDTMDVVNYIGGTSQAFHFSGSGIVHGISAYMLLDLDGVPGNSAPVSVFISVYNINGSNYPTTLIEQDTVMLMDVGFANQDLNFNTPVAVSDSFAVAIEIDPTAPSNPYYITNVSASSDGQGEKLSCVYAFGSWFNAFDDFGGWDMDILIAPNFEQDITASYTIDTNTVCLGNPIAFTNTSVLSMDSMFFTSPHSFSLDLGDLNVVSLDTSYIYTAAGTYNTSLEMTHFGYNGNCMDTASISVTVLDTAIANYNFSPMGGGAYQFTDASTNANTYYWDFGDGDTSTTQSPIHTFSVPNTYNVCFTVTDTNGCNVNTFCQNVSFVTGVEQLSDASEVNIFPVPANKYFNVQIPSEWSNETILVTDIVGKTIKMIRVENQKQIKILTNDINSGVYFVSIENNGQKVYTKRIIIDKN